MVIADNRFQQFRQRAFEGGASLVETFGGANADLNHRIDTFVGHSAAQVLNSVGLPQEATATADTFERHADSVDQEYTRTAHQTAEFLRRWGRAKDNQPALDLVHQGTQLLDKGVDGVAGAVAQATVAGNKVITGGHGDCRQTTKVERDIITGVGDTVADIPEGLAHIALDPVGSVTNAAHLITHPQVFAQHYQDEVREKGLTYTVASGATDAGLLFMGGMGIASKLSKAEKLAELGGLGGRAGAALEATKETVETTLEHGNDLATAASPRA